MFAFILALHDLRFTLEDDAGLLKLGLRRASLCGTRQDSGRCQSM